MEWLPPVNEFGVNAAAPLVFKEARPSTVLPSWKLTCPVASGGVTVAVKVTNCPCLEGFDEEVRVMAVGCEPVTGIIFATKPAPPSHTCHISIVRGVHGDSVSKFVDVRLPQIRRMSQRRRVGIYLKNHGVRACVGEHCKITNTSAGALQRVERGKVPRLSKTG